MPESNKEQEILAVHQLFWESYSRRDLDTRFALCSDDVTFIGTGLHERAANKEEYRKINEQGFKEYPDTFKIDFNWTKMGVHGDTAWVECEVVWNLMINNAPYKELINNTTILKYVNNEWKVVHVHGSVPDYRAMEGEYMTSSFSIQRNLELEKQVFERTTELSKALENLKATQAQLIQSEKMASLGELTAGIAHEIQNPLNFVNNFSEVNIELVGELKEQMANGNLQLANELADNIKENEVKINEHGNRADGIVKSMLQHSRLTTDKKELADINNLADEYMRLAYHGWRAKDKSFNSKFEIHFDPSIEKMNIVRQDIGRVVLNLLNNAFYAVNKKKKELLSENPEADYEPAVIIRTRKSGDRIEIVISDNGNGIPQKALDKIFQPFFTTKPAGEGTGLGLSLSYDIVKAHGGELQVETKENAGTTFIITLPV
jgi:signal transduction histidine kinase